MISIMANPMSTASEYGNYDIVKLFIEKGSTNDIYNGYSLK
jgi:hypothetical protein